MCRTTKCARDSALKVPIGVPHSLLGGAVVMMQAVPLMTGSEGASVLEKALQQGGLLAVCLVLLWIIRENHKREREKLAELVEKSRQETATLIDLVGDCRTTMERSSQSSVQNADAIAKQANALDRLTSTNERLAVIVERVDERRRS